MQIPDPQDITEVMKTGLDINAIMQVVSDAVSDGIRVGGGGNIGHFTADGVALRHMPSMLKALTTEKPISVVRIRLNPTGGEIRRIGAIKAIRAFTYLGLMEAKDIIDLCDQREQIVPLPGNGAWGTPPTREDLNKFIEDAAEAGYIVTWS